MNFTTGKFLRVAKGAARKAGRLLVSSYGKLSRSQIRSKSKNDFVTELDRKSEECIISWIQKHFPDHAFLAEERGRVGGGDVCWIIDPLDGTANYIHQFPIFSISIGVMRQGKVVAGVIYDPCHDELFSAARRGGAFLNERRIRVSETHRLADALMATGIPFRARERFDQYLDSFGKISLGSAGMRRGGSAALDLAYVACGRFDGFWELRLSPWDIAAGALLIQEAGGKITDVWGRSGYLENGDVLASNSRIHRELCGITSKIFTPRPVNNS